MKNCFILQISLAALLYLIPLKAEESVYQFVGHHFVASLMGCNQEALTNVEELAKTLEKAAVASGAQILTTSKYVFPGNGLTMVILLSESHASIHTYPEFGACFIDLFTCGHHCSAKNFEEVLESYLKPQEVNKRMLLRDAHVHDEDMFKN